MSARRWLVAGLAGAMVLVSSYNRGGAQAPATPPAGAPKPAALVNNEPIAMAEVEALVRQGGMVAMQLPEATRRQMQRDALAELIDAMLLDQFLRTNSAPLPAGTVDGKMAELATELKKENKTLSDFCKYTNQTEEGVRKGVERMLRWDAYVKAKVADTELQRYYAENKDFFDHVLVRASHIALRVPPGTPEADVTKAREKLTALRADLIAGKITFADAAKAHSQCPVSGPQGGDVGQFPRKLVTEEAFARAAFALQPNQISAVAQTSWGLHLILVTERHPGTPSDFAKVKEDVRALYSIELRESTLNQMRQAAKIDVLLP